MKDDIRPHLTDESIESLALSNVKDDRYDLDARNPRERNQKIEDRIFSAT